MSHAGTPLVNQTHTTHMTHVRTRPIALIKSLDLIYIDQTGFLSTEIDNYTVISIHLATCIHLCGMGQQPRQQTTRHSGHRTHCMLRITWPPKLSNKTQQCCPLAIIYRIHRGFSVQITIDVSSLMCSFYTYRNKFQFYNAQTGNYVDCFDRNYISQASAIFQSARLLDLHAGKHASQRYDHVTVLNQSQSPDLK